MSHTETDRVRLTLPNSLVTEEFRQELFQEANRAGVSSSEFLLRAAAAKLLERGRSLSGVYPPGDIRELAL